jgi:DHA2 family methylenomycin A resistance protein-like MFS transporter
VGLSPTATGWRFVPETVAAPLFTTIVTRGLPRLPAQRALLLGVGLSATGLALLAFFGLRGSLLFDVPLMIAIGVGAGAPTFLVAVMLGSVPAEQSGLAAGTVSASRQVGGLLGVALLGGVVGHSPSDAGVRVALGLGAAVMAVAALLTATLRTQPAHEVDMNEALAESMA